MRRKSGPSGRSALGGRSSSKGKRREGKGREGRGRVGQTATPVLDTIDLISGPAFAVTMLAEWFVLRGRPRRPILDPRFDVEPDVDAPPAGEPLAPVGFERRDTMASLAMLTGNVAVLAASAPLFDRLNQAVYGKRIANLGKRRGAFVAAMVLWDFLYYWDHRWMHEVRIMWANHVNHHSGRRYNLSTALRQPWTPFVSFWVFLPMPLLGFSPAMVRRAGQLNLLYQYWIHTEAIDHLPRPVEAVFNTPSHHRVHHGADRGYLDTNYAGIFIVWDRLFGTFQPEQRRPRYGLTKNIHTYNPFRIAYHEFAALARDVVGARSFRDRVRYVVGRPGWAPTAEVPPGETTIEPVAA